MKIISPILSTILCFFILLIGNSQNILGQTVETPKDKFIGFTIYLLDFHSENKSSHRKLTPREHRKLLKVYKSIENVPNCLCDGYVPDHSFDLETEPFLKEEDILYYSSLEKSVYLTRSGISKISKMDHNLRGRPFIISKNEKILLKGSIRPVESSFFPTDQVFITVSSENDRELDRLELRFINKYTCGNYKDKLEQLPNYLEVYEK